MAVARRRVLTLSAAMMGVSACASLPGAAAGVPPPRRVFYEFNGPLVPEQLWQVDPTAPAIRLVSGALRLQSGPSQTAFVRARFVEGAAEPAAVTAESLEWHAEVGMSGAYFIVLDAQFDRSPFRVQLAPFGLHVTSAAPGQQPQGAEIRKPGGWQSQPHKWQLTRAGEALSLLVDGEPLWRGEGASALTSASFGETHVDALHGGVMLLRSVRWERVEYPGSPRGANR